MVEVFQVQRTYLTYEWNDVALLTDQRAYTIICKTMLKIPQQELIEIQDVVLNDWVWQRQVIDDMAQDTIVPFQGSITVQIDYLNRDDQQETFFAVLPLEGAWEEPVAEQNSMRLTCYYTQAAEGCLLLETVFQMNRSKPLEQTQVLLGQFQLDEQITLEAPWPTCSELLQTSVNLQVEDWTIDAGQLQIDNQHQIVCVYQSRQQAGEQVFVYEYRLPMKANILIPEGLQELNGIMPYYQSITAQLIDETSIHITGTGVFCTLPANEAEWHCNVNELDCIEETEVEQLYPDTADKKESAPSVVNSRGSRRAKLSKYMRNLNNSVETPNTMRNIELNIENE